MEFLYKICCEKFKVPQLKPFQSDCIAELLKSQHAFRAKQVLVNLYAMNVSP